MGAKVGDVMTTRPRAVTPQTPLNEVAEVMRSDDVGSVPVVEGDRLVGIVTDRDIVVRAIAQGKDPTRHACLRGLVARARDGGARRRSPTRSSSWRVIRSGAWR